MKREGRRPEMVRQCARCTFASHALNHLAIFAGRNSIFRGADRAWTTTYAVMRSTARTLKMKVVLARSPARGDNSDTQRPKRAAVPRGSLCTAQWQLVTEHEPALGSHLVTARRGYLHHGIYVGLGKVVHYGGLAHGLRRGPVEEVSLARFTRGRPVWARSTSSRDLDYREVIRRALSRLGQDCYRLPSLAGAAARL